MTTRSGEVKGKQYGMVIDVDGCTGCGACMMACAVENNIPPTPAYAPASKALHSLRVSRLDDSSGAEPGQVAFLPVLCQHCGSDAPCVSVCPQNAVEVDPKTGIVFQVASRCLGCRYCMAACPYHARSFNWWDPVFPDGAEQALNPDVSPRMRGVVEKCNFCHGRLQAARESAAAEGRKEPNPGEYTPACVEACPAAAIVFGDLADPQSEVSRLSQDSRAFRLLERLGTEPKVHYLSSRPWVRQMGRTAFEHKTRETVNG
jgi:menaquinone reductase, iron-sulfur cluster-binding subunit